jgi:type I restriction enzyme R subunit
MGSNGNLEYSKTERPFIKHLQALGWDYLPGDTGVPYLTERESFRHVLLLDRLREALSRINLDEAGNPWLDDARITQAVGQLQRPGKPKLMAANQAITRLLIKGTQVTGPDGGKAVPVHYIDYEHPERNDFLVVNQFRVDPPWASGNVDYAVPDLVLFVNGIPLVVVECKRPDLENPLTDAITQLLRYSNCREGVREPEGVERLFRYAQLMVATCGEEARLGTVGASYEHYLAWKDVYPKASEVSENFGSLTGQETLIAGALRPEHLLNIVRNFTLFTQSGGQMIKIVPRYQQFRAVHKAVERLQRGPDQRDGIDKRSDIDKRSGIIWHTQGSGKSLVMVFLIRKMRTLPELRRYKIVLMTDRVKLEDQLAETAALTREPLERAGSVPEFLDLLRQPGAGLVFGMIQKMQEPAGARHLLDGDFGESSWVGERAEPQKRGGPEVPGTFPTLNDDEEILLLVDEAHRSHTSTLHARLMTALPNAAKIGFTGTPILEQDKKQTHQIFGPFIDTYKLDQSQKDGATVRILYEGRTVDAVVRDGETLDEIFEGTFSDRIAEEVREIREQYVTSREVMEAKELIAAKARDMLRHYVTTVMPDGFKGQIVAVSRRGAVRYQKALLAAKRQLVADLEELAQSGRREPKDLVAVLPYLDRIRRLNVATVISGAQNDPRSWRKWTRQSRQDAYVADFKKPFDRERGEGYTALLVVVNMLLTGFDAPLEQALYIDRPMHGYELLQAIARVNRTYPGKEAGLVVDYVGLAGHLDQALEIYTANDIQDALQPIEDLIPLLRDRYHRVVSLFTGRGLTLQDTEACVNLLREARLRARFTVALQQFLQTLNTVLPRPEALPYVDDAQQLGLIRTKASKRYRDQHLTIAGAEAKVRKLIDDYVIAQGVDPKVPPIDIMAAGFEEHVEAMGSPRARAAEMEFAARHHIRRHWQEDPVYYQKLSERLEEILQAYADNWEAQVEALRDFIRSYRETREEMSREDQALRPFLRLLVEATPDGRPGPEERERLASATVGLVDQIREEISRVDFWRKPIAQEKLRRRVVRYLDDHDLVPFEEQEPLADQIVQTARANHTRLMERGR